MPRSIEAAAKQTCETKIAMIERVSFFIVVVCFRLTIITISYSRANLRIPVNEIVHYFYKLFTLFVLHILSHLNKWMIRGAETLTFDIRIPNSITACHP